MNPTMIFSSRLNKTTIQAYPPFLCEIYFHKRWVILHNALAFYNKKILQKYPFNESLTGKEDRYWAKTIIKNRKNFLYDPSMEVFHHYTKNGNTWKGIG